MADQSDFQTDCIRRSYAGAPSLSDGRRLAALLLRGGDRGKEQPRGCDYSVLREKEDTFRAAEKVLGKKTRH